MTEAELGGGFGTPTTGPTTDLLAARYLKRVRALPAPTQRFLLIAAADATGDPTLLWRAAQAAGLGHDAAEPARTERLLEIGSGVRFRHPLMRAAAYAAGSPEERRAAHRALADATDPAHDPDRRVWHLAAAAAGPDEAIAGELERSAERAQARAGLAAAAALLQRSVALTAAPERRAERALAAAHAHLHAGSYEAALSSLAEAEADAADDLQRARVEKLRAEINRSATWGRQAPLLLLRAARRLEPLDPLLARQTFLDAWGAALVAGALATPGGELSTVSTAARTALAEIPGTEPCAVLLDGLCALILDSLDAAAPTLRTAVHAFLDGAAPEEWLHYGVLVSNAALTVWDFEAWDAASSGHVDQARAAGATATMVAALNVRRVVDMWAGNFQEARTLGVAEDLAKQVTGTRRVSYGDLFQAALEGAPEKAHHLVRTVADEARTRGEGLGWNIADRATALLELGLGRYAQACAAAARAAEGNLGPFTAQALPDLVEAACRSEQPELAAAALRRLQAATAGCDTDWAAGVEARSRALLTATGSAAEGAYQDALTRLARTPLRIEHARAQLLYGEWLRREARRADAREQLHAAHDTFAVLGVEAFAERARRELVATGEKVRKRQVDTLNQLTPQEEHIARLARDGQSNPEIAAQLFISARTVEWHLRKVFGKLDISSRRELREALPGARTTART